MNKANNKNFIEVLDNIGKRFKKADKEEKKEWVRWLNQSLDELLHEDFFGTEGQLDPRGDQRDSE
jgi:hypothetical protein